MSADSTWCGINISFPAFLPTTPRTKQHQQCTTYAATPHTTEAPLDRETVADREKESSLDPARRLSKTLTLERGGRRFHQHIARRRRPQRPPPPMHHGKMLTICSTESNCQSSTIHRNGNAASPSNHDPPPQSNRRISHCCHGSQPSKCVCSISQICGRWLEAPNACEHRHPFTKLGRHDQSRWRQQ